MKSLAVKREPALKIHRYVVAIQRGSRTTLKYLENREELRAFKKTLKLSGSDRVNVFKATHDFKEAWASK